MPSVSIGKKEYDKMVILVGGEKVNAFIMEAVKEKLSREVKKIGA